MARSTRHRRSSPAHSRTARQLGRTLRVESLESRFAMATVFSPLVDRIEHHLEELPGIGGAAVINLTTGEETLVNGDDVFGTSSTIKSGVLFALARKIDAEQGVTWSTEINVGAQYGTNQSNTLTENQLFTLEELATTMIVNSNNWATNRLIDYIGRNAVNGEFSATLGLDHTRINRYLVGPGSPSAHGQSGPGGDYEAGWDNVSTPREISSMLRQIHENDGLLSNFSYNKYWEIMGLDSDGGENTRGYSNDYYGADTLNGYSGSLYPNWAPLMEFYNKAGSNTWNGDPGDFVGKPGVGDHWQRSEAGRVVLANGEILFYATFADNSTSANEAEEWIASVGYEMAVEYADSPVTFTPSNAQLDDGRVVMVHGNNLDNQILITTSLAGDSDNLQVYRSGALTMDIDAYDGAQELSRVNRIYVFGNGGDDQIDVPSLPVTALLTIYGGSGHDTITTDPAASIFGGTGNDIITTGGSGDFVNGEVGNDTISTGSGNDLLFGGGGNDTLRGGDDSDTLHGDAGDDDLDGGSGVDQLHGGDDNDFLVGGAGADILHGDDGNDLAIGGYRLLIANSPVSDTSIDTIDGGLGNDTIIGDDGNFVPFLLNLNAGGNDILRGGAGDDGIFGGFGNDSIQGGAGNDTILAGLGDDFVVGGSTIVLGPAPDDGDDYVNGGGGDDTVLGDNFDPNLPSWQSADGGDDQLVGEDGNDHLYGQFGHDELDGGANSDELDGGVGNDNLTGGGSGDLMRGRDGADILFGEDGVDLLDGGAGNDILVGGTHADQISGGDGDDFLNGEAGADLLIGGLGNDQIFGGADNDQLVGGNHSLDGDAGADSLDGGDGDDLILGDSGLLNPLNVSSLIGGNDIIQGGLGNDTIYAMAGADFVGGGMGNDVIYLGAGADIANGDSGNDQLRGGDGDDLLAGSSGVDQLFGEAGNDWLIGGNYAAVGEVVDELDADSIEGGVGNDFLFGDSWSAASPFDLGVAGGNDNLLGGDGDDLLAGQAGNDTLRGGNGNDTIFAGDGHDSVWGDAGNDQIQGGAGDDRVRGGAGNDTVQGGLGHDILLGEAGADTLAGDSGRDLLIGGLDSDSLNGGDGDDILIGGTTTFDGNDAKLDSLRAEWTSLKPHANRVANLRGSNNPTFKQRLNDKNYLKWGRTVVDDRAVDQIVGGNDSDWFFLNLRRPSPLDVAVDKGPTEAVN